MLMGFVLKQASNILRKDPHCRQDCHSSNLHQAMVFYKIRNRWTATLIKTVKEPMKMGKYSLKQHSAVGRCMRGQTPSERRSATSS